MTQLKPLNATDLLTLSKHDKEITLLLVLVFLIDFHKPVKVSVSCSNNIENQIQQA
jgi:hypothetical protein